jgi:hypothetical protein
VSHTRSCANTSSARARGDLVDHVQRRQRGFDGETNLAGVRALGRLMACSMASSVARETTAACASGCRRVPNQRPICITSSPRRRRRRSPAAAAEAAPAETATAAAKRRPETAAKPPPRPPPKPPQPPPADQPRDEPHSMANRKPTTPRPADGQQVAQ